MARYRLGLAAVALMACWPVTAQAQAQAQRPRIGDECSVGYDPVWVSQPYDPTSPNDYVASFTATARRGSHTLATNYSALLLRHGDYRLLTEVYVLADDGSGAGNVAHERPGPSLEPGLDDSGEIDLAFPSSNSVASRTVEMQLRIPAGTAIDPGIYEHVFDVKYLCDYQDGRPDRGNVNRGFAIYLSVSSVVQASLVGSEPDFGEIGTLSTLDVAGAPASVTQRRHYMRVASTGPYQVDVTSQNGWRMTAGGAPTGNEGERIRYQYELLGQTLSSARPNFTPVRCAASGVSGENITLTATLTEGGQGKVPSPNYRDVVTITVTPMAVWAPYIERCD
jgi:hypothetical protein